MNEFPGIDDVSSVATRDALHVYSRVLGDWLKSSRTKRKHWWHASLRPALHGLTTGVVHQGPGFELELNLRDSQLLVRTLQGQELAETLHGQPASALAGSIAKFLTAQGLEQTFVPETSHIDGSADERPGYSADVARRLADVLNSVAAAMTEFRAGIREETSPIQLWPHHFDLSMLWLPGEKIPGQDPADEEYSDKQMNFGFTFGDASIPEPYFYVSAYPQPDAFPSIDLPAGTSWHAEGFNGAVLKYGNLCATDDPQGYLLDLWQRMLSAGREHMLTKSA
ncbi:MAG: DUF5996 family protein [Gammaproteobacteria bacterium]